ncbi:hypothetical protein LHJ74_07395 [Streptomyces sp. N2-109]|uniref:Uncharacterized protein n=1 Tax=Streptomyces gossypii TaxID=2883101 RepID=A0ABT2JPE9_9ACTN|nr:hypothetical protein [Streptomyces gossypii]MCT2589745.1 hypothetical protein [Streptomyces gossypii]
MTLEVPRALEERLRDIREYSGNEVDTWVSTSGGLPDRLPSSASLPRF